jgi:hypothetical protein
MVWGKDGPQPSASSSNTMNQLDGSGFTPEDKS